MSDEDEHITESELGTKEYWERFYDNEITNFNESGDPGETWFGMRNTYKIIEWVAANIDDKNALICDLGCGNGYILSILARKYGFTKLIGIDYSQAAIDFCRRMFSQIEDTMCIRFEAVDILNSSPATNSLTLERCEVLLDKGTYDAICLMPNANLEQNRRRYLDYLLDHLKPNGHFVIMSCNFTKQELCKFLLQNESFQFVHEFETPKILFGGKTGNQVTGLVLRRRQ